MMPRTLDELEQELRAVARGEREPSPPPPSPDRTLFSVALANLELTQIIAHRRPASVSELAEMTGRAQSNVSRSLQELARHGLVRLVRDGKVVRPELVAGHIDFDLAEGTCRVIPRSGHAPLGPL